LGGPHKAENIRRDAGGEGMRKKSSGPSTERAMKKDRVTNIHWVGKSGGDKEKKARVPFKMSQNKFTRSLRITNLIIAGGGVCPKCKLP